MEDVIWFLVNYPVFLLLVMNICAYWKRDRVTEHKYCEKGGREVLLRIAYVCKRNSQNSL